MQTKELVHCGECSEIPCELLAQYSCDKEHGDTPHGARIEQCKQWAKNGGDGMKRSMMQVFVKGSAEAAELYQKAFNAELLCAYPDNKGGYIHAELDAYGQILAVSEIEEDVISGNTMMFCFHFGESGEKQIQTAYDILKEEAISCTPIAPCDYSSCQFVVTDKFGVYWCLFV